jgi:hypothetical protein
MPTSKERVAAYKLALDAFEVASQTIAARLLVSKEPTADELFDEQRARRRLIEARRRLLWGGTTSPSHVDGAAPALTAAALPGSCPGVARR